jgi:predicted dehydrogenase
VNDTNDLKLGVVGLGQRCYLGDLVHHPGNGSRVVALADPNEKARVLAASRFPQAVTVADSHEKLLDCGLDAVIITTPDHTHEEIIIDFLRAGIAVFAEKPLAITTQGCDHILEVARESGTRLYVGHNMRHMPVITTMKRLIDEGTIGQVKTIWCRHFVGHGGDYYFKDWHAERSNTTGLLLQKGAHDIDVIHWLAGAPTGRVTAMGALQLYGDIADRSERVGQVVGDWFDPENNWPPQSQLGLHPVIDVEDVSMMLMQLRNGVLASYQQCHFTPDYWRNYTVIGTEGRLENFGDEVGATVKVWSRRSGYRDDADLSVEVTPTAGSHGGADELLMAEFLQFVRDGSPTLTSPVDAREAVAAGWAATMSLRDGNRPIVVPPVSPEITEWFDAGQSSFGSAGSHQPSRPLPVAPSS